MSIISQILIIHLEVSIILFTFVPVMLGQASAIKARNQVFEYPLLSKLAGCFLYHGTGCTDTTISSFHQLFLLLSFVLYIRHHIYSTSTTSPYSASTTTFIPLPPLPLFRFRHHPPSTAPKSTSSTSASRHRRHRSTDIDDVDLEGVKQGEKRMCRYRTYTYAVAIITMTTIPQ